MDSGFEKILGGLKAKEERKEKLRDLPFSCERIPADELKALAEIRSKLNDLVRRYAPPIQGGKLDRQRGSSFFDEAVRYLDDLSLWEYKFTTDSGDDSKKLQLDPERDSMYYLTHSGVSLRLKKANLFEGDQKKVISPFADSVFFVDENDRVFQEPKKGLSVREYITDEFHALQNGGLIAADFVSPVKYHLDKDGAIKYVEPPLRVYHYHEGHVVNQILFKK